jgi:hypothetical protein
MRLSIPAQDDFFTFPGGFAILMEKQSNHK